MQLQLYSLSNSKKEITFSINLQNFELSFGLKAEEVVSVFVTASFTLWLKSDDFEMNIEEKSESHCWSLTKPLSLTQAPGNTGFPEFNFLLFTTDGRAFNIGAKTPLSKSAAQNYQPCGEVFDNNFVILTDKAFLPEIKNYEEKLLKVQSLKDYNLKLPQEKARLANVRKVPGSSNLWRGYHPYKKSRPDFDTENTRIKLVNKALKKNHIKSIITLCGNEEPDKSKKERISRYVKKIQKAGNQLFIDTSYERVYFQSDSQEYGSTVKTIVDFIISHPAPFYIHCRLGSDRTGTMCSILAALCGASWQEIIQDYEKTSRAGFGEFRSYRLLEYSYKKLLGKSPDQCADLQKELENYFVQAGILTIEEIEGLRKKLLTHRP